MPAMKMFSFLKPAIAGLALALIAYNTKNVYSAGALYVLAALNFSVYITKIK